MRWIYAFDFDGVIVQSKYPDIGKPKRLAWWAARKLYDQGHSIIVWTSRSHEKEDEAALFLIPYHKKYGVFPPHWINESDPENLAKYGGIDNRKIYADRYLDDHNPLWCSGILIWVVFEGWLKSKNFSVQNVWKRIKKLFSTLWKALVGMGNGHSLDG